MTINHQPPPRMLTDTTGTSTNTIIRCMFHAMVDIGVVTAHNHDDGSSSSSSSSRPKWLRHNNHFNDSSHFTTLQHQRTMFTYQLRGLHQTDSTFINDIRNGASSDSNNRGTMSNITTDPTQSSYLLSDSEANGAFTVGMVVCTLLSILIVLLFLGFAYCACWLGYGGYVTCIFCLFLSHFDSTLIVSHTHDHMSPSTPSKLCTAMKQSYQ